MHILSSKNRSEFLATPSLVRFDYCDNEPILLIKASSLLLKYLVRGVKIQLIFTPTKDNRLLYAVKIFDDPQKPVLLWSVLEGREELSAIEVMVKRKECPIYLFNELAVNVAWLMFDIDVSITLNEIIKKTEVSKNSKTIQTHDVEEELNNMHLKKESDVCIIDIINIPKWREISSIYITNKASSSPISIFNKDEGRQQEELAIWLTDNIHPKGAIYSPQILIGKIWKELTDIVLSYEYGAILFESKALSVLCGDNALQREKLKIKISKYIKKADSQLTGAIRKLRNNVEVRSKDGDLVEINRESVMHAIILVSDCDLVCDADNLGRDLMCTFYKKNEALLHILDIAELLRIVQAAKIITSNSGKFSLMRAFDCLLMERFQKVLKIDRICSKIIFKSK